MARESSIERMRRDDAGPAGGLSALRGMRREASDSIEPYGVGVGLPVRLDQAGCAEWSAQDGLGGDQRARSDPMMTRVNTLEAATDQLLVPIACAPAARMALALPVSHAL